MKTLIIITLLSLNNPKDTTKSCIKTKSCCKLKTTDSPKYCVGLLPKDTIQKETKKPCCKKRK